MHKLEASVRDLEDGALEDGAARLFLDLHFRGSYGSLYCLVEDLLQSLLSYCVCVCVCVCVFCVFCVCVCVCA